MANLVKKKNNDLTEATLENLAGTRLREVLLSSLS
jgi:hypothetical protein